VIIEMLIDAPYKRREGDGQKDLNVAVSPDGQNRATFKGCKSFKGVGRFFIEN
jgi:hypothetical protein